MRRVPPAIIIAIAVIGLRALLEVGLVATAGGRPPFTPWFFAISAGATYTVMPLLVAGTLELRQRGAAAGFAAVAILIAVQMRLIVDTELFLKPVVREVLGFGLLAGHLIAMGSLAMSVWTRRPGLAVCAIAAAILTVPPPALAHLMYAVVPSTYLSFSLLGFALRMPELVVLLLLSIELARDSEPRPVVVANGLRQAARALCLFSAVAALAGIPAMRQPFVLAAAAAGSLGWCAFGLLRAARSPASRWFVAAAAAAILWCMSMLLSSLLHLDRGAEVPDRSVMMMFMLIAAAAFISIAVSSVVDKMQLQAKGVGSIVMFVTALAIGVLLVPQSQSERSMIALDVLTGFVVALGAWMLSWLCRLAAQRLERSDGDLPAARVVSGPV